MEKQLSNLKKEFIGTRVQFVSLQGLEQQACVLQSLFYFVF